MDHNNAEICRSNLLKKATCNDNELVTRYEATMLQELAAKDQKIAILEADNYTDKKIVEVTTYFNNQIRELQQQISQQATYNATVNGTLGCMAQQIAALQGITKTIIPADNVCPQPMPLHNSWTAPTTSTATA